MSKTVYASCDCLEMTFVLLVPDDFPEEVVKATKDAVEKFSRDLAKVVEVMGEIGRRGHPDLAEKLADAFESVLYVDVVSKPKFTCESCHQVYNLSSLL